MKESTLWKTLKAAIGGEAHLSRIENSAGTGISDINACRRGVEVWIELKVFRGNRVYFKNSQLNWITTRATHGGKVWLLARKDSTLKLWDASELLSTSNRKSDGSKGFSVEPQLAPTWESSKPFKWKELTSTMFGDGSQS